MRRIFIVISFLLLAFATNAVSQIACPAMGLTQVNKSRGRSLSGFASKVRKGKRSTQMGDFFTRKKGKGLGHSQKDPFGFRSKKAGKTKEHSEFASKNGRRRLFKEFDEFSSSRKGKSLFSNKDAFASRSKKKGRFRSYDEFATRSKRGKRFRDFDEFAYNKRTKKVNIDSQFAVQSTTKRFRHGKKQKSEFRAKKKRAKQNRSEYTPFASSVSPSAGQKTHRSPQVGLWGGSIGNRSGKDKRPMRPLPEPAEKED